MLLHGLLAFASRCMRVMLWVGPFSNMLVRVHARRHEPDPHQHGCNKCVIDILLPVNNILPRTHSCNRACFSKIYVNVGVARLEGVAARRCNTCHMHDTTKLTLEAPPVMLIEHTLHVHDFEAP
jgi:hypothetical protein